MRLALRIASGIALLVGVAPAQRELAASSPPPSAARDLAERTSCASQPLSIPGCATELSVPVGSLVKGAGGRAIASAAPVPGGVGRPGFLVYSVAGLLGHPLRTSFGTLCLSQPNCAFSFPAMPGGTEGRCDGAYTWNLQAIVDASPAISAGDALYVQAWYRKLSKASAASFTPVAGPIVVVGTVFPTVTGVTPSSGGEGTQLTITGSDFGNNPLDLQVLLAAGVGFADVTATTTPSNQAELQTQAGNPMSATVFNVGNTGNGPATVIRGTGSNLAGQNIVGTGITSNSTLVRQLANGLGTNFGSFNLGPGSASTVSVKSGSPLPGGLSLDLMNLTGDVLEYRLCFKLDSGKFLVCQGRIEFVGMPDADDRAEHLAKHLEASFGNVGVDTSFGGSVVRVSMAGAAYGGIVVAGK